MFHKDDYVVYPAHGVGQVIGIESQTIEGYEVQLLIVAFERDRMTLRLPVQKAQNAGLRPLTSSEDMEKALEILGKRGRVSRAMWSRRSQEYETKINSGNPVHIAEVIRDLFRKSNQSDQSYSERQIYQAAVDRLARELAIIDQTNEKDAIKKMENYLRAA